MEAIHLGSDLCFLKARLRGRFLALSGRRRGYQVTVFVSHSNRDHSVAEAIVQALESNGVRAWFAPRDMVGGADFASVIPRAIRESRLMVILLSTNAMRSRDVHSEVSLARREGLTLLPIRLPGSPDPLQDDAWHYRLVGSQVASYSGVNSVVALAKEYLRESVSVSDVLERSVGPVCDVVLTVVGEKKILVIQEIRSLTGMGLKEAKDFLEGYLPRVVLSGVSREAAEAALNALRNAGAKGRLEPFLG